jgi:hypothetical protein
MYWYAVEWGMQTINSTRYTVFQLESNRDGGFVRTTLGTFRFYTDAYILLKTCQEADLEGNYWIHDDRSGC